MVGVDVVVVFYRIELDLAGLHLPGDHLADVLHRRHILVVVLQRVVGVRVGGDDPPDSGRPDGLRVVVPQGHEQRLFAEPPDFMAAISFRRAQNSEILSDVVEDPRGCPPDRLHPVVVGGDAVDEIQSLGASLLAEGLDVAGLLELLALAQSALFFSILPYGLPRLSSAFSGFCRDCGTLPSSTMPRRRSTILSMYSTSSGHSSSQAPQVVQDQISSSE